MNNIMLCNDCDDNIEHSYSILGIGIYIDSQNPNHNPRNIIIFRLIDEEDGALNIFL
jgi:hypothetical protein